MAQWLRICLPTQGHKLDPCSSKIPRAERQPSPRVTATEARLLRGPHRGATTVRPTHRHGVAVFATTRESALPDTAAETQGSPEQS